VSVTLEGEGDETRAYIQFVSVRQNTPAVIHPNYGMMNIREDHRP